MWQRIFLSQTQPSLVATTVWNMLLKTSKWLRKVCVGDMDPTNTIVDAQNVEKKICYLEYDATHKLGGDINMASLCSRCGWSYGPTHKCGYPGWKKGCAYLKKRSCIRFKPKNLIEELRKQGYKPIVAHLEKIEANTPTQTV